MSLTRYIDCNERINWLTVLALALAIFAGSFATNLAQMGVNYGIAAYQDYELDQFQKNLIKDYEATHPGSKPMTKDYKGDGQGGVKRNDNNDYPL